MSLYNLLLVELGCPWCHRRAACEVEFKLGLLDLRTYRLGDTLRWAGGHGNEPLRRPDEGCAESEGYTVCPHCERDFWVRVEIRNDLILAVTADPGRQGYIA
ncbi:hypothetical protein [Asanoa siamensis]|uniref:Trm112 family protein n=1 Tax=Asanoa siamensis TaxID=926357 RepID=A0ABQ4CRZ1_9ACTN|nr:hypothetical protein [Asanoa siamensis]GIF74049.1 hypothetical protein Asi02nite_35670 [Asanoa siamensis]